MKKKLFGICKKKCPKLIKSFFTNKNFISEYETGLKKIRKNKELVVVFVLQYPETWNSLKTVYENFKKQNVICKIICIPKVENINDKIYNINKLKRNDAFEFMKENKDAINAYLGDGEWYNLKKLNPDYVFYTRPYNYHYPDSYKTNSVCQYSKICYIPYGFTLCDGNIFNSVYNNWILCQSKYIFVCSRNMNNILRRNYFYQYITRKNEFLYFGYPRFDLLKRIDNTAQNDKFTITWMPRWEFDKNNKGQKYSHFLDYYEAIVDFAKENKDVNFIIRPHPLMFKTMVQEKIKTEQEVNEIKKYLSNFENIIIDNTNDYMECFCKTDLLIADTTSLLIEFFVTGKPIILTDTIDGYMKDAKIMAKSLYNTLKWDEIKKIITDIKCGNDKLKDKRRNALSKIIKDDIDSGEKIVNYLIQEWKKDGCNGK